MIRRKRIAVLGVSLAALGLMSVGAAGAQAGQWTIDGKALSIASKFESEGGPVTIAASGVTIKCPKQYGYGTLTTGGTGNATLILYNCAFPEGDPCQVNQLETRLEAKMTLSETGSQVNFYPQNGSAFGTLNVKSVEEECYLFTTEYGSASLAGKLTASVGSAAVKLPLSISNAGFFVGFMGMQNSEIKGSSSIWLTGANAGKVLGTSS